MLILNKLFLKSLTKCFSLFLVFVLFYSSDALSQVFDVGEMIGKVTNNSAEIFMQLGDDVTPSYTFQLFYDTVPRPAHNYAYSRPVQTNKNPGDTLTFNLSNLTNNQKYYYCVKYNQTWQPLEHFFHTRRTPQSGYQYSFCVISDFHHSSANTRLGALQDLEHIVQNVSIDPDGIGPLEPPDFVITLGDMVDIAAQSGYGEMQNPSNDGCSDAFYSETNQSYFNSKYELYVQTLTQYLNSSMIVLANGNHEGLAGYLSDCSQFEFVMNARKKYLPLLNEDNPDAFYGDFTWGDVQIIWLDPLAFGDDNPWRFGSRDPVNCTYEDCNGDPKEYKLGDAQADWLENTLGQSTSKFKLIFSHSIFGGYGNFYQGNCSWGSYARGNADYVCPSQSSPCPDNSGTVAGTVECDVIERLMEEYGVSAHLYGHDHLFALTKFKNNDNTPKYICVGNGMSAKWIGYWFCGSADELYCANVVNTANDEIAFFPASAFDEDNIGHLRVDVYDNHLHLTYIKVNGQAYPVNIDIPANSIEVDYPASGASWEIGATRTIEWTSHGVTGENVKIDLCRPESCAYNCNYPITSITANDGSRNWQVQGPPQEDCKIRVTSIMNQTIFGESEPFDIVDTTLPVIPASDIKVVVPGFGEWLLEQGHLVTFTYGDTAYIKWKNTDNWQVYERKYKYQKSGGSMHTSSPLPLNGANAGWNGDWCWLYPQATILQATGAGIYDLYLVAKDTAGNTREVGPFDIEVKY